MKNLTDYIAEAYEYNYNISNVPKYTSTGTDKVDIKNKTNNKTNYTVQPKNKDELSDIITNAFKNKQYDLNFIDTSKITDMSELFININHNFDVSKWDVSNVTDMSHMFNGCENFDCDLSKWDTSRVKDMHNMFAGCEKFNCNLSNWDVSNVTNMSYMFDRCTIFKGEGLENWDISYVTDTRGMFRKCYNFKTDLSKWNISNMKYYGSMFKGCNKLAIPSWYEE